MKLTYQRVIAFFLLIALSVGFGFAFDGIATAIEKRKYPLDERYAAEIQSNAEEFGVPETVLWATVRTESDFVSNLVSETGEIGLMQLSPTRFQSIYTDILNEPVPESGMLYDPATNLRAGAALLSELYRRYGVWETVYAAYFAGEAQVDLWLADPELVNEQGRLQSIPDKATAKYVKQTVKATELYEKLYYSAKERNSSHG